DGTRFNYSITPEQMATAIATVEKYSVAEKIRRIDDVFADQPAVLGAAVQLPSLGGDGSVADHAFHVLLVLFECFTEQVPKLPKIEPTTVQKAFDDIASMLRFYDGETDAEAARLHGMWVKNHKEHAVIAFVVDYLSSQLPGLSRESELVRNCCLAMTNAYLATYEATQ
ncbi:MAG TPA: hypothetical protein P5307_11995, partial [Pirellulaceae bacterium]|nr:hypothetical protein [Pirellulaceae bacterium]